MKFKRQRSEEVSVNLTPLIDVVFLLLIFFMIATTFTRETQLQIELPEASGEERAQDVEQVEVEINAAGDYVVNQRRLQGNDRTALREAVSDLSGGNTSLPFVITADAKTPHEFVVRAMDVAGSLGFTGLRITTQHSPDED
ncbi:MAG: biopolymer transporter ExbD [Halomonadaceae bacterium]|nr:MAG: biopolymer transporter ExbD [Halomonadaceae bacterium]